jgi:hypothetical protein
MHEKKDAEVAENTRRLFSILQTIQNELTESRSDTQMALKMFQDLTFAASRLEQVYSPEAMNQTPLSINPRLEVSRSWTLLKPSALDPRP